MNREALVGVQIADRMFLMCCEGHLIDSRKGEVFGMVGIWPAYRGWVSTDEGLCHKCPRLSKRTKAWRKKADAFAEKVERGMTLVARIEETVSIK